APRRRAGCAGARAHRVHARRRSGAAGPGGGRAGARELTPRPGLPDGAARRRHAGGRRVHPLRLSRSRRQPADQRRARPLWQDPRVQVLRGAGGAAGVTVHLTRASAPLTERVLAVDELGQAVEVSIPAERALTLYVDKRELVT